MTSIPVASPTGRRSILVRHRPLALLLPLSLVLCWTIALAHGPVATPPANQGLLADLLTALATSPLWRMAWWLWLAGTLVLLESLARRYGVRDLVIVAIGVLLIVQPTAFWAYGWAGTDGPLIFFGALALWLAARTVDGRGSGWSVVLCALVAGAFGATAVLVFVVVLIQFIGVAVLRRRARLRLVVLGIVAVLAAVALPLVGSATGLETIPASAPTATAGGTLGPLGYVFGIMNAIVETGLYSVTQRGLGLVGTPDFLFFALGWLLIAGVVVAFLQARRAHPASPLVVAVASSVLLAGPVLVLLVRLLSQEWLVVSPLGAAVLLPAYLVVTSTVIHNRFATWTVLGLGAVVGVTELILAVAATR